MIYFKRTGKQRPNFEGNSGTKTKSGNREHKKTFFIHFGGTGEEAHLFQGNKGTGTQPGKARPRGRGRLLVSCVLMREQKKDENSYFFRAGQCAALSSFRVGKMLFL